MNKLIELKKLLKIINPREWGEVVGDIYSWVTGWTGMRQNLRSDLQLNAIVNFYWIGKIYSKNIPNVVYRMANVNVPVTSVKSLLKSKRLTIGNKSILSCTKDKNYPKQFYDKFYKDLRKRKNKHFAYVNVEIPTGGKFLCDTDSFIAFLNDLKMSNEFDEKGLGNEKVFLKSTLSRLNSKFIQSQQEAILKVSDKVDCKVIEIFWPQITENIIKEAIDDKKIEDLVAPYIDLPLECDGLTKVLSYILDKNNIEHKVCIGNISTKKEELYIIG